MSRKKDTDRIWHEANARLEVLGCSRETHKAWLLSSPRALVQEEWMKSKDLWFAPT